MNTQLFTGYALSVGSDVKFDAFSGEAWAKAAEVTLIGMGMIFAVRALLWGVLTIFKLIFAKDAKAPEVKAPKASEPVAEAEPVPVVMAADDSELIAVISAAIAAYRASEEGMDSAEAGGFRVVSFKRAGTGRAWNSNK